MGKRGRATATTRTADDPTATSAAATATAVAAATAAVAAAAAAARRAQLLDWIAALGHDVRQERGIAERAAASAIGHRGIATDAAANAASGNGNPYNAAGVVRDAIAASGAAIRFSDIAETAAHYASTAAMRASDLALGTGSDRAEVTAAIAGGDAAAAAEAAANAVTASQAAQTSANEALATITYFMNHNRNATTNHEDITTHTGSSTYNTPPTNPTDNDD